MDLAQKLQYALLLIPILIVSATFHELAHAWVADRLGDPTARKLGRLTLNPIKHLDPIGSLSFIITYLLFSFPFGWAKPVPVYPGNLKIDQRRGMALVAAAGPITNFILAGLVLALATHGPASWFTSDLARGVIGLSLSVNIVLGVFNLLPIPPLDGSRIIGMFMRKDTYEDWMKLDQYAPIFLLLIIFIFQQPAFAFVNSGFNLVIRVLSVLVGADAGA